MLSSSRPLLALVLFLAVGGLAGTGCGEDLPMVNAFPVSCSTCHASTLTGSSRFGAPANIDFDTFAAAMPHAMAAARAVFAGAMPPTGVLPAGDKEVLYRWALCGAPP